MEAKILFGIEYFRIIENIYPCDQASVADVLVGQAKVAFEASNFAKFESLLLRAQRPELAVKQYRDTGMWPEALRVCKEYLPHKLKAR